MNALRRVASAPGLLLVLWLGQLALAWQLADGVRVAAGAGMGEHAWVDDGHLLAAITELLAFHPSVAGMFVHAAASSAVLGAVFWALAYGGVIRRLSERVRASEAVAASVRYLPGVVVQSIYSWLLRALPMAGVGALAAKLPVLAVGLGLLVTAIAVVTADLARVEVVLHGSSRFSPMTALRALRGAFARPRMLAGAGALAVTQSLIPLLTFYVVLSDSAGEGSIWLARGLGLVALALGLWRIAVIVEHVQARNRG